MLTCFSSLAVGEFEKIIDEYINEEVGIQKTRLGIRNQKCYAVKVITPVKLEDAF